MWHVDLYNVLFIINNIILVLIGIPFFLMCLGAFSKPKWTKINRNKKAQTTYVKKSLDDGILKYEVKNVLGLFYLEKSKISKEMFYADTQKTKYYQVISSKPKKQAKKKKQMSI